MGGHHAGLEGQMNLLILGANGQVGRRLGALAGEQGHAIGREALDFTNTDAPAIERLFEAYHPSHIINAVAYNAVDEAEQNEALAQKVNAETPKLLAEIAQRRGIPFVHFSSDYVFDGKHGNYAETAPTNLLGAYARSKLAGEQAVLEAGGTVFRLQWVYDVLGTNFYLTMRRLLAERTTLNVVADQIGAPSFAGHIAQAVLQALDVPLGLYHLTAGGHTSWHGFATAIGAAMGSQCTIAPITAKEYPTAATRPRDTRLDASKLAALGISMPHWREGLKEALHETN